LQEVKSLNQKELNSLKLTISDMRNMQKIMPIIQQQLDGSTFKDGKINGVSVDVNAMTAEMNNAKKELFTLIPNLTFADFHQLTNLTTSNGKLVLPNYNKETASDSLNRFIELSNQASKYIDAGVSLPTISAPSAFQMEGVDTITGQQNGFLNHAPALSGVASFANSTQNPQPALFNWEGGSGVLLSNTMTTTVGGFAGTQPISLSQASQVDLSSSGSNLFEYMTDTTFATFSSFVGAPPIAFNNSSASLLSITMSDAISAFCATGTACRDKLSHGDLVGFYEDIKSSLPEGVALR
jgi:hypothetical protein